MLNDKSFTECLLNEKSIDNIHFNFIVENGDENDIFEYKCKFEKKSYKLVINGDDEYLTTITEIEENEITSAISIIHQLTKYIWPINPMSYAELEKAYE